MQCRALSTSSALTHAQSRLEIKDFQGDKGESMKVDQSDNSIMIH